MFAGPSVCMCEAVRQAGTSRPSAVRQAGTHLAVHHHRHHLLHLHREYGAAPEGAAGPVQQVACQAVRPRGHRRRVGGWVHAQAQGEEDAAVDDVRIQTDRSGFQRRKHLQEGTPGCACMDGLPKGRLPHWTGKQQQNPSR